MTSSSYSYDLPQELIAQKPVSPRDAARLLVYDRQSKDCFYDTFANIGSYLPPKSVIIFNASRVIPARLWCTKESGGKVQLFYIRHDAHVIHMRTDRKIMVGAVLKFGKTYALSVVGREDAFVVVRPNFATKNIFRVLNTYGTTPIPPYIKHAPLSERSLRQCYQTVFARSLGSVAAPTASLHFTPRLLRTLRSQGHSIQFVTLHVGLGTFAPLTDRQLKTGKLHQEFYEISPAVARALNAAKNQGRSIVAVGTTVARTLESSVGRDGRIERLSGATDIFIRPGYQWKFVDDLITNFHVPNSSLMMLVASLIGRSTLMKIYRDAIKRAFRFYSFGDGMLIR